MTVQLDGIKNSYEKFSNIQIELVKQYPNMVKEELSLYEEALFNYFSIIKRKQLLNELSKDKKYPFIQDS